MKQEFFKANVKNPAFLKFLDKTFDTSSLKIKKMPLGLDLKELEEKFSRNNNKIDKELLVTLEYYFDKNLYKTSMSALKEAMQEKAKPYVPL